MSLERGEIGEKLVFEVCVVGEMVCVEKGFRVLRRGVGEDRIGVFEFGVMRLEERDRGVFEGMVGLIWVI